MNQANTLHARTAAPTPEWIRLPSGTAPCPYTGLSRATIYRICIPSPANGHNPKVKSRVVKSHPANISGRRLVHLPSLLAFIESQPVVRA